MDCRLWESDDSKDFQGRALHKVCDKLEGSPVLKTSSILVPTARGAIKAFTKQCAN